MDTQNLDRLAYSGAETPPDLGYADALYYMMLRALYSHAKSVGMDPETGRREKAKIVEACKHYRADMELVKHCAEVMRDTGAARTAFRKAAAAGDSQDCVRAAYDMAAALDGMEIAKPPA